MNITNKIFMMFMAQKVVSFVNDIAPVVLEKYQYGFLNEVVYATITNEIEIALKMLVKYDRHMIGVPVFTGDPQTASLVIKDFEYRCID